MPRNQFLDWVFVTVLLSGLAFLAVDVLFGDLGVDETSGLKAERRALQAEIRALEAERARLEARTKALIGPAIDRDLLDEQLRARLGVGRADDALLQPPSAPQAFPEERGAP
ncbi:MAG: hypothetical protein AAF869_03820 [Pseudomonadota bacterium]